MSHLRSGRGSENRRSVFYTPSNEDWEMLEHPGAAKDLPEQHKPQTEHPRRESPSHMHRREGSSPTHHRWTQMASCCQCVMHSHPLIIIDSGVVSLCVNTSSRSCHLVNAGISVLVRYYTDFHCLSLLEVSIMIYDQWTHGMYAWKYKCLLVLSQHAVKVLFPSLVRKYDLVTPPPPHTHTLLSHRFHWLSIHVRLREEHRAPEASSPARGSDPVQSQC